MTYLMPGFPDRPPAVANPEDDEFNAGVKDAKWTQTLSLTAAASYNPAWAPSCVGATFTGAGRLDLVQAYTAASLFAVTTKFHVPPIFNNQRCWVQFLDTAGTTGTTVIVDGTGSNTRLLFLTQAAGVYTTRTTHTLNFGVTTWYLHMQRNAANVWQPAWSSNGVSWQLMSSFAFTVTITKLQVLLDQNGSTNGCRMACDWVRRDWLTV